MISPAHVMLIASCAVAMSTASADEMTITTFAGPPEVRLAAVDGPGPTARLRSAQALASDRAGNIFVADTGNHTIRVIGTDGSVTTLAGAAGTSGDADGRGFYARFVWPEAIAVDRNGYVYVGSYNKVRKVTTGGVVTSVAGAFSQAGAVDDRGIDARFGWIRAMAADSQGFVYVADSTNYAIRKVSPLGEVTTFAGRLGARGTSDGSANLTRFGSLSGIATDANDNVYVSDTGNRTIRKVTPAGIVTTIAGVAGVAGSRDGIGASAQFLGPGSLTVGSDGNVYVVDPNFSGRIRQITPSGAVTTLFPDVVASAITADAEGNLVAATQDGIVRISPSGARTTVTGTALFGDADGTAAEAQFMFPAGIAGHPDGNVYVADSGNHTIRKVTPERSVSTIAGLAGVAGDLDGSASSALFTFPRGITADLAGNLYVTANNAVRKIGTDRTVTTFAGLSGASGYVDGEATAARFSHLTDVAADSDGTLYVSDTGNNAIRRIRQDGVVSTVARLGSSPVGIAVDQSSNIYVSLGDYTLRKVASSGSVTLVAGSPYQWGNVDGRGEAARFHQASPGLALDSAGNIYVLDHNVVGGNGRGQLLRRVTPDGVVTTLAGGAWETTGGLNSDGTGRAAAFSNEGGLASHPLGLLISDYHIVRLARTVIEDVAVTSPSVAPIGVTRQIDTSPQTASSWLWEVVRRPTGSTAPLSSASIRNPTFTPEVPGLYKLRLTASSPSGARVSFLDLGTTGIPTSTTLSIVSDGNGVLMNATVAPSGTGTVTFFAAGMPVCIAILTAGSASCTTTVPGGQHTITAAYEGDATRDPSTSNAQSIEIARRTSSTMIASSPNPAEYSQQVTFTATVTGAAPTGSVQFSREQTGGPATPVSGAVQLNGGIAVFHTSDLRAGNHALIAVYGGDASNLASSSQAVVQVINRE